MPHIWAGYDTDPRYETKPKDLGKTRPLEPVDRSEVEELKRLIRQLQDRVFRLEQRDTDKRYR